MTEGQIVPPVAGDNTFAAVLNLLTEQKNVSAAELLALLSLTNLLGIVTYINSQSGAGTFSAGRGGFDKQALMNMLMSLLAGSGDGSKKEALGAMLNLLSTMASQGGVGGKKPDPAALMNLLSSLLPPAQGQGPAKYAADEPAREVATSSEPSRRKG
jgi:hypothetical protein